MAWKKSKRTQGKNKYHSLSKKLRKEQKSTDEFVTAMASRNLAMDWIDRRNQRRRRRHR